MRRLSAKRVLLLAARQFGQADDIAVLPLDTLPAPAATVLNRSAGLGPT